ncbi:uncharacterized protein LOC126814602 [Patella vulgata]|uniref:uncharacterized protein LOC126814602 n=1 Tax=Patella vulgata TaxID=6465 RepID=UPI00217FC0BD|nr:uncharacterized protein LOC126814602 [Patella vulgata]
MWNLKLFLSSLLVLLVVNVLSVHSSVNGITRHNVKSYTDNQRFLIVFIDSRSCTRCKNIYKNFVAASQSFEGDKDIYFGKTTDLVLIKRWDIQELPAVVYFPMGVEEPALMEGDCTVDNILDHIAFIMKGDFTDIKKNYHVDITEDNFEELIMNPVQHAILLIYDQYHEEQKVTVSEVAKTFREDDDVVIATLDADKYKAFRDKQFKFVGAPLLYWYPIDDKFNSKRFGGDLTSDVILNFINEETNSWRNKDGTFMLRSGRYPTLDRIIDNNLGAIARVDVEKLDEIIEEISKAVDNLYSNEKEFGQFYIYLLQQIQLKKTTKALSTETDVIFKEMENLDLFNRRRDTLIRKHHILDYIVTNIGDYIISNPNFKKEKSTAKKKTSGVPDHHEL